MMKRLLALGVIALVPLCAFAIDGVTLINQSTVMAAGGFPFKITEAGSYQLSGNLQAPPGKQAILVAASNVALDLNGFNVSCTFGASNTGALSINCVGDSGAGLNSGISDITIRNGTVTLTQTQGAQVTNPLASPNIAVGFLGTHNVIMEELHVGAINQGAVNGTEFFPADIGFGVNSIVRHNILGGGQFVAGVNEQCPSLLEGNVNTTGQAGAGGTGCVLVNNIGTFF